MSNIKTSKKIILITLGILLVLSLLVGVSYAYYIVTHSQTNSNIIKSTCISLSLTNEQNDISLDKQYPISDEDGKALTPYSFTITNTCRNAISYNLNLEMLEGTTLDSKYVKTMLNDNNALNLATLDTTDTSINTSTEARTLIKGALASEESINYEFRMWMDSNTEADVNSMNKEFLAKIVVTGVPTKVYNFDYTGTEQVFTALQTGTYKIETWGAQGGDNIGVVYDLGNIYDTENQHEGGYGGYSIGSVTLSSDEKVYINVGGAGSSAKSPKNNENYTQVVVLGGYNGGGKTSLTDNDGDWFVGSGGGATHIAMKSGLLSTFENQKNNILIVSGGGGGSYYYMNTEKWHHYAFGGSGGGFQGQASYHVNSSEGNLDFTAYGGKQEYENHDSASIGIKSGVFGQGGTFENLGYAHSSAGAGGGGGYYGGSSLYARGAGGGSGYIGNSLLTNKAMYCYNCEESNEESTKTISTTCAEETPTSNCAKKGNGYARITYIGS